MSCFKKIYVHIVGWQIIPGFRKLEQCQTSDKSMLLTNQGEFCSKQSTWTETLIQPDSNGVKNRRSVCLDKPAKRWKVIYSLVGFYRSECHGLYQSTIAGCCSRKTLIRNSTKKKAKSVWAARTFTPCLSFSLFFLGGHLKLFNSLWPRSFQ